TLNGTVKEVDLSYLDKIYDQHPEMLEINKTDSERRELLWPFEITPTDGFVYDLQQTPIFPKAFTF
ncbi:MAG: pyridoxamine 5'-phosphate oxidase family protein, partial [Lactobacillus delbrueckii]